jgi:hypothetical protein
MESLYKAGENVWWDGKLHWNFPEVASPQLVKVLFVVEPIDSNNYYQIDANGVKFIVPEYCLKSNKV